MKLYCDKPIISEAQFEWRMAINSGYGSLSVWMRTASDDIPMNPFGVQKSALVHENIFG